MPKQPTLCFNQPAVRVIGEAADAFAAKHPMAWDKQRKRVGAACLANGAGGTAQRSGHFAVAKDLTCRNLGDGSPYALLEGCSAAFQR